VRGIATSRLVYLDETGTNVTMTRRCSRSKRGKRAYGKAPRNHRKNLTVIGAIALDGVRAMMAYEGGTTKRAFMHFLTAALIPSLNKGDIVVMDNLGVHHTEDAKRAIREAGADVLYLPPYSPELNPIELTWSKMKAALRKIGARTLRRLAGALPRCRDEISILDIQGWYRHVGLYNHTNRSPL